MIISDSKKFIFIHMWKTGGTSIKEVLSKYNSTNIDFKLYSKHINTREIKKQFPYIFDDYYKFIFVRNPWDIQVSYYNYVIQNKNHFQHKLINGFSNFQDYIIWRTSEKPDLQYDFVYNEKNEILVDFVGKFENLNSDFNKVINHLELPKEKLRKTNASIRRNYKSYYNDFTIELIEKAYLKDIETFNYTF